MKIKEILPSTIVGVDKRLSAGYETLSSVNDYYSGKEKIKIEVTKKSAEIVASTLNTEIIVTHGEGLHGKALHVKLVPTDMTNEIISRWKELNSLNPELPYPQEEVVNKDWLEVGLFYNKELIDLDLTISDYILGGILPEGQTAEELVAGELYQYEE